MKVFHSALKSLSLSFIYFYASVTSMRVTKRKLSWWSIPGLVWWKEKGKLAPDEWKKFWLRVDHVATGVLIFFGLILLCADKGLAGIFYVCVRRAAPNAAASREHWGSARAVCKQKTHSPSRIALLPASPQRKKGKQHCLALMPKVSRVRSGAFSRFAGQF
jgi:hypothetical protein